MRFQIPNSFFGDSNVTEIGFSIDIALNVVRISFSKFHFREERESFGLSETDKSWFLPLSLDETSDERVNKRLFRFKFVVFHKKNLID